LASIGCPPSSLRKFPAPSKCSNAKPRESIIVWHDAHDGLVRCSAICWRNVFVGSGGGSSGTTFGGGGGMTVQSRRLAERLARRPGEVRYDLPFTAMSAPSVKSPSFAVPERSTLPVESGVTP